MSERIVLRIAGDAAVLIETPTAEQRERLDEALLADPPAGLVEQVPGLRTLLLAFTSPAFLNDALPRLRALDVRNLPAAHPHPDHHVELLVRYDGPDLADVAQHLGLEVDEVIDRHTGQTWRVAFTGFTPGFGYLTSATNGMAVPRLPTPRTRVPAGSVALADGFTGVYPRSSPGGWRLIGTTDARLWDTERTPPALLAPGTTVTFRAVQR